jgi:hypothetical protein
MSVNIRNHRYKISIEYNDLDGSCSNFTNGVSQPLSAFVVLDNWSGDGSNL